VTLDELKSKIDKDVWDAARREAWESAPGTGTYEKFIMNNSSSDVLRLREAVPESARDAIRKRSLDVLIDALYDLYWSDTSSGISDLEVTTTFTSLYREIPSYSVLSTMFVVGSGYQSLGPPARALFWAFVREMVNDVRDALADPIVYSLWCDFFENDLVDDAWNSLELEDASDLALRRILQVSGPVPFRLKERLYVKLLPDKTWHDDILRSLHFSIVDVFGSIDRAAAQVIFLQLSPSRDCVGLAEVKKALFDIELP
jgi:hypothetical protein